MKISDFIKRLEEYDTSMELAFEMDVDGLGTMKAFELDIGEELPYCNNQLWIQIKEVEEENE
jgi:hypothetical protein